MTTTIANTIVRSISDLTGRTVSSRIGKTAKLELISESINESRYEILGLVGRSNNVMLRPRFHNVRNKAGRFTARRRSSR
jgi:hypothetical protein